MRCAERRGRIGAEEGPHRADKLLGARTLLLPRVLKRQQRGVRRHCGGAVGGDGDDARLDDGVVGARHHDRVVQLDSAAVRDPNDEGVALRERVHRTHALHIDVNVHSAHLREDFVAQHVGLLAVVSRRVKRRAVCEVEFRCRRVVPHDVAPRRVQIAPRRDKCREIAG